MKEIKKIYIETYGCQMNFSDSEIVIAILEKENYEHTNDIKSADVIFLNTCSIRDNAEQRIYKRLEELAALKKHKPNLKIGLLGCMAERLQDKLFKEQKHLDLIAGPDSYRSLASLLQDVENGQQASNVLLSTEETYAGINPVRINSKGVSAFISITRGCENFCTYCVVPYTRGKERSRNVEDILNEANDLYYRGYKEITLLGQNVNSYLWEDINFAKLIVKVAEISPLLRVRFATSHPKDLSDELINAIAEYKNICNSIHLPVQSGNSRILQKMNRKYDRNWYLNRIKAIKENIPNCAISTDIIAGFCSETEEEHGDTLSLMKEVGYDYAYMFFYSNREGTVASKRFEDDVDEKVKKRRLSEIIEVQRELSLISNKKDIGKTFEVLVEGRSKKSDEHSCGRNSQNKMIVFPSERHRPGEYVLVKISSCTSATLLGEQV